MNAKDVNTERNNFYVLLLLICLFLLAIAASLVYVIFPHEHWSGNAGVLIGLWASALGLIAILFTRRRIGEWQRRVDSLQLFYEVQLDKEVLARAEYEQSLQATVYQSISERYRNDIEALRGELRSLKQNLETLTGGALRDSINSLIVASKRLELTSAEGGQISAEVQGAMEESNIEASRNFPGANQSNQISDITSETRLNATSGSSEPRLRERDMTDLLKKTPSGKILFSEPFSVQGEVTAGSDSPVNVDKISHSTNEFSVVDHVENPTSTLNNFTVDVQSQFANVPELDIPLVEEKVVSPISFNGATIPTTRKSHNNANDSRSHTFSERSRNRKGIDLPLDTVSDTPSGPFARREATPVKASQINPISPQGGTPIPSTEQPVSVELDLGSDQSESVLHNSKLEEPINKSMNISSTERVQPKVGRRRRHESSELLTETENLISGKFSRVTTGQHRHGVSEGANSQSTPVSEDKRSSYTRRFQTNQRISGDIFPPVAHVQKQPDAFAPPIEKDAGDEPAISSDVNEKSYSTYQPSTTEIERRKERRGTGKNITDILAQRPVTPTTHRGHRRREE